MKNGRIREVVEIARWADNAVDNKIANSVGEHERERLAEEGAVASFIVIQQIAEFGSPLAVLGLRECIDNTQHIPNRDGSGHMRASVFLSARGLLTCCSNLMSGIYEAVVVAVRSTRGRSTLQRCVFCKIDRAPCNRLASLHASWVEAYKIKVASQHTLEQWALLLNFFNARASGAARIH